MKEIIGIIPARGGSKRIPNKNIKLLHGKPLINYTIKECLKSKYLTDIIVSTDSEKIANISKRCGANVPFIRPKNLAGDRAPTLPVLQHAIKKYEEIYNKKIDIVVLLQPTSPLRKAKHIDEAIGMFLENKPDSVISVTETVSPSWTLKIKNGSLKFVKKHDFRPVRRNDHEKFYQINGVVYVFARNTVINAKNYAFGRRCLPYVMLKTDSIDIDNMDDLRMAKMLLYGEKQKMA